MTPGSFRNLDAWQRGMDLVDCVFTTTRRLPPAESDLRQQMRRAAISIPANLAEGFRRNRRTAYQNHVSIAMGSHGELETHFEVAFRNHLLDPTQCRDVLRLCESVGALLYQLRDALEIP
jgi:four helix bundle protein